MQLTIPRDVVRALDRNLDLERGRALVHDLDPKRFGELGPDHTERFVVRAIGFCEEHALGMSHDLAYVLFVMIHLGSYFDEDPRYTALAAIFADHPEDGIDHRLERARRELTAIGDRTIGADGAIRAEASRRFASMLPELEDGSRSFDDVRRALAKLYPMGEEAIPHSLLGRARDTAEALGLQTPLGEKLSLVLVFWLGAGVARDPLFPWVRDLAPRPHEDPPAGVKRLAAYAKKRFHRRLHALMRPTPNPGASP